MKPTTPLQNPGVQFPPPTLFAIPFGIAWLLDDGVRALPLPGVPPTVVRGVGAVVMIIGLSLAIWGVAAFRRVMTAIFPNQPANELVTDGPYKHTRNPMYVGFTLLYVGGALALNSLWPFVLLPVVLTLLFFLVVRREEAYLSDAFGEQYAAYRHRVRRWF